LILVRDEITGIIARPNYQYNQANYNPGSVANKVTRYYYVDGKRVGDVSNDGPSRTDYAQAMANRNAPKGNYANWKPISSADFDQNYEPVSPSYPGFAASTYTVRNGDTLQSIARTLWGDAAMWFLIADANGLTDQALTEGQTLTIPNKVTNVHNNSATYRLYNAGEAIGDTSPTLPTAPVPYVKKKKGKCGGMGGIIVAVVAVVATIYTAGVASLGGFSAAFRSGVGTTMGAGVAALGGSGALSFGGLALAGAAGSIAGQLAGNALGVQQGFSWGAVATSALTTAIGGRIGSVTPFENQTANLALNAGIRNSIGQGVNIATGQQKSFNWSSVAVSAVAAPVMAKANSQLFGEINPLTGERMSSWAQTNPMTAAFAEASVSASIAAVTSVAIQGGKLNWNAIAADTLTGFIQSKTMSQRPTLQAIAENLGVSKVEVGTDGKLTRALSEREANTFNEAMFAQMAQNPSGKYDIDSALDAALGAGIAERITELRKQIASDNSIDLDGSLTKQLNVATNALLSKDSYYANGLSGLLPAGVTRLFSGTELSPLHITARMLQPNDGSGYMAGAYRDDNRNIYIIANKGTVNSVDWQNNIQQTVGAYSQQYEDAQNIARLIKISEVGLNGRVEYTGHSLGVVWPSYKPWSAMHLR